MATPKQTDPQFKLRITPELRDAIEAAAKANNRTMNAEILARLEQSFDDLEGYRELAELFVATMQDNADQSRREVEEYRQMVTTIRLHRYIITRLLELKGDIPEDLENLVGFLAPKGKAADEDPARMLEDLYLAIERHERIEKEMSDSPDRLERRKRVMRLLDSLEKRTGIVREPK